MKHAVKEKTITVPLLDLKGQYKALREEIRGVIDEVCDSQYFILGPYVESLEKSIAEYCGVEYGIGVSSGTDALLLALMALDVGHGDEVITSPYTFFATGGVVARVGARPLFCDIDPVTYNLSPDDVERFVLEQCEYKQGRLINKETNGWIKVLIPVHLYGQCADMPQLMEIAGKYNLKVVEDCAQAIGSEYRDGKRAGSFGDIGCFSFFPSKNLGAFGDGGMCVARNQELAERLRIMRMHGSKPKYYHALVGGNFRLDALQAAVLEIKLKHLDKWTAGRQRNAKYYDQAFKRKELNENIKTPVALDGYRHIYNQYVIRVSQRDQLRQHLTDHNVGTEIYYPVPLHLQECFSGLGYTAKDCPVSNKAANETLALPIYPELTEVQLQYVVDVIASFYPGN